MVFYKKEQIIMDEIIYYLYHIPGKKVGVTRNLNNRVTLMQGYSSNEYEVLDSSRDIEYISKREIELQKSYGYKVDIKPYNKLFNKMKINSTEQTSTFPFPLNKLKGNLMDNIGLTWETEHGKFELNLDTIKWIMNNAIPSMYNDARTFVYNKAFATYSTVRDRIPTDTPTLLTDALEELKTRMKRQSDKAMVNNAERFSVFDDIRSWAKKRGLYKKGDSKTQYIKLQEEAGELAKALLSKDREEIIDAIGDMVVVLTNLAHLEGVDIEYCVGSAYSTIANRTGEMVNGTFVKDGK
jgi:NTP pyrophosphatase (non-canonical NTP hydrolase)